MKSYRFDFTGGMASFIVLAARVVTSLTNLTGLTDMGNTKSAETGMVKKYGTGYNDSNAFEAVTDFLVNKTTPATGVAIQMLKGKNRDGTDFKFSTAFYESHTPISLKM